MKLGRLLTHKHIGCGMYLTTHFEKSNKEIMAWVIIEEVDIFTYHRRIASKGNYGSE